MTRRLARIRHGIVSHVRGLASYGEAGWWAGVPREKAAA